MLCLHMYPWMPGKPSVQLTHLLPVTGHFINPLPWEKSAGTWSIFKLFIQACLPWLRCSSCFPCFFSSKAPLQGDIIQLVFRSVQLVLKSLTLNFPHQLDAMSPARTGCHISKILNVYACSCPFFLLFPTFPCFKLKEKSQWELIKEKILLFFRGDWFFFMFLYCFYMVLKKGTTHSLKISPASVWICFQSH